MLDVEIKDLPEKTPGVHRYVVVGGYSVTEEEMSLAMKGEEEVPVGPTQLFMLSYGCWDCQLAPEIAKDFPCDGTVDDPPPANAPVRPWSDPLEPGRQDINGVEWWACDPYPTWYRWENGNLRFDHDKWADGKT